MQNPVGVADAAVELGLPVVRLDLGGQRVPGEPERGDELLRDRGPVLIRVGGEVSREGAGGSAELAEVLGAFDLAPDALEAVHEDGELLAHRGGGRRLAVRVSQHRGIPQLDGEGAQGGDQRAERREPDLLDGGADRESVGEVVDVLARAGEVGELGDRVESLIAQSAAHQVLDRLDVVTGGRLQLGEGVDLRLTEVGRERPQARFLLLAQGCRPEQPAIGQGDEPLHFHVNAGPVESGLREVLAQRAHGGSVASVERAQRLVGQAHGAPCRIPGLIWRKRDAHARSIMERT